MYILDDHYKVTPSFWFHCTIFDYLSSKSSKIIMQDFASRCYFPLTWENFIRSTPMPNIRSFRVVFWEENVGSNSSLGYRDTHRGFQHGRPNSKQSLVHQAQMLHLPMPITKHHWYSNINFRQHHANVTYIPIRTQTFTLEFWFILTMGMNSAPTLLANNYNNFDALDTPFTVKNCSYT